MRTPKMIRRLVQSLLNCQGKPPCVWLTVRSCQNGLDSHDDGRRRCSLVRVMSFESLACAKPKSKILMRPSLVLGRGGRFPSRAPPPVRGRSALHTPWSYVEATPCDQAPRAGFRPPEVRDKKR